ncbi:MAG: tail fiber domain-containing protein [Saprospiraceae bacterium]|nr:tail fiber domain-containing protein [Saprospiraceae bacterium]
MKTIKSLFLFLFLIFSHSLFSQISFPHIANSNNNSERVASFRVNDSSTEFLEITNSTVFPGQFIPSIWAHHQADNRNIMRLFVSTNSVQDNGNIPLLIFRAEIRNSLNLTAPNSKGNFPWGTIGTNVINRPLYAWENGDTQIMRMLANGNVGIGTIQPTSRLHTYGTVRFENLPELKTNTYLITSDENGNLSKQSLGIGNIKSNCITSNFIPKISGSEQSCSQIFDNGLNIGIGTTSPENKLTVNGAVQSISNLFISDAVYKESVNPINNSLELISKLEGSTYYWKTKEFPEINFDNSLQYGLIAQDVEQIIPSIVSTSESGTKAINYTAIIPILIEAIKQQQEQIIALTDQISSNFEIQNYDLLNLKNTKIISISPNPSTDIISVSFNIDDTVTEAKLVVYEISGKLLNSLIIKERGFDLLRTFQKQNFGPGAYIVSIIVNGKSIDSKKFIFN